MGKTDPFTQFYPTSFTQWVKLTVTMLSPCAQWHRGLKNMTGGSCNFPSESRTFSDSKISIKE